MKEVKASRKKSTVNAKFDKATILDLALQEFANNGFDGARLKVIAQNVGIASSLMNYHFKNREDLWKQAVLHLGVKLKKRFEEIRGILKDLEGLPALKAYTRQFIYFSAEHPEFYKIVFHEMCTETERATWLIDHILAPVHQFFEKENIENQDGSLLFRGYSIASISSIIIGAANVFFIHAFQMRNMYGINPFDKKEIERHADTAIDLLFAKFNT